MAVAAVLGFAGSAGATTSICDAIAGNLVMNCGFETGNFSGWTTTPAAMGSFFGVNNLGPNSGNYAAYFEASSPPDEDMISQSIMTTAGDTYSISFFLDNIGGSPNQFTAMFGSTTLLSLTNSAFFPSYTEYSYTEVATGSSTTLSFAAYQVATAFYLDDISIVLTGTVPVPEPSSLVLLGSAVFAIGVTRRRRGGCKDTDNPDSSGVSGGVFLVTGRCKASL